MGRILQFSDVHFGCEHKHACAAALESPTFGCRSIFSTAATASAPFVPIVSSAFSVAIFSTNSLGGS